jgi:hypothetical protein
VHRSRKSYKQDITKVQTNLKAGQYAQREKSVTRRKHCSIPSVAIRLKLLPEMRGNREMNDKNNGKYNRVPNSPGSFTDVSGRCGRQQADLQLQRKNK